MRVLLGLIRPTSGTVRVLGKSPLRGNPEIGYLPQVRTLMPAFGMRGVDFITSSVKGERWGLPITTRADRRAIEQTLTAVGATALADRALSDMGGRAAALAARAGAARFSAAPPTRRAADQP
jgi:zinc/manganese transport system ATP-binding protein